MGIRCYCAICNTLLQDDDQLADHHVRDAEGDLDYIELAHRECAIKDNGLHAAAYPDRSPYWAHD